MDNYNNQRENLLPDLDPQEDLHIGLKILALIIPLAGLIMYFVYQNEPLKRKSSCKFALIGVAISLVLRLLLSGVR